MPKKLPAARPKTSTLERVVIAALLEGGAGDPETLQRAARVERESARIATASRALHEAHLAVVDAANEWETDPDNAGSRTALCATVRRWRAAGETFVKATRGEV